MDHPIDAPKNVSGSKNHDIIAYLTTSELSELISIKDAREGLLTAQHYLDQREGVIFAAAGTRMPREGAGQ